MANRQVVEEWEGPFQIVTIFETKISRKRAAKIIPRSRSHRTLVEDKGKYKFLEDDKK